MDLPIPKTIRVVLQPRDRKLIDVLSQLRFVDREQASRIAPFTSASRAKSRLLALVRAGHLSHEFVGTINGGRKAIYSLPRARKERQGSSLLSSAATERFIEHQLWLNELYLILSVSEDVKLVTWERLTAPIPDKTGVIPDAFVELAAGPERLGMFLEMDLGTESLTVWKAKVEGYLNLARSNFIEKQYGLGSFRVLVVARDEGRVAAIRRLIAMSTDRVFWLASTLIIKREGFWSPIWLRPTGDQKHSLI